MPDTLPTNLVGLFIFTIVSVLTLLAWLVRRTAATQERTTTVLDNHMANISTHMAATNVAMNLIVQRLLDVSLRKPEDGEERRISP